MLDMPVSGKFSRDVANEARRIRPDVNVLLATAYSPEIVALSSGEIHLVGYGTGESTPAKRYTPS